MLFEPDQIDFDRIHGIFARAAQLRGEARSRYLDEACGRDTQLRRDVDDLLRHHDDPLPVLAEPWADKPSGLVGPDTIGPYRILGVLGRGGMGVVYRAEQHRPNRAVALKVLQPGLVRDDNLRRFEREAEVLGLLQHPGIASIYDAGTCDLGYGEMPYFAMELVDGEPLTDFANRLDLDVRAKLSLVASLCDAVQHAHERGVVHRDLKPSNVLVVEAETGNGEHRPKILDFGIARTADTDIQVSTMQTSTGQLLGTLPYMSPEQIGGNRDNIDARSDLYSLGVLLYELLAGRLPLDFEGHSITEVARIVRYEDPKLLGQVDRQFRGDVETITDKALRKEQDERYVSAAELASDLRRYLCGQTVLARPQTAFYQIRRFASRNRPLVAGVCAVFLTLLIGLVAVSFYAAENKALAHREGRLRRDVEAAGEELRSKLYVSNMRLVAEAIRAESSPNDVRRLLDAAIHDRGATSTARRDLRGWEWFFADAHATEGKSLARVGSNCRPTRWLEDGTILVMARTPMRCDSRTGEVIARLPGRDLEQRSPDGEFLAKLPPVKRRRHIVIRTRAGATVAEWKFQNEPISVRWSPDSRLVAIGFRTSVADPAHPTILVHRVDSGACVAKLGGRDLKLGQFGFSATGRFFAALHERQARAIAWDTATWRRVHDLTGHTNRVIRLATHPTADLVATGGIDGRILVFDLADGSETARLEGNLQAINSMCWSADGKRIASGGQDRTVRVFAVASGKGKIVGRHDAWIEGVCFSPCGTKVASGGASADGGQLRVWEADGSSKAVRNLVDPYTENQRRALLQWHPTGSHVVSPAGIANVQSRELVPTKGRQACWNRDGELLAWRDGTDVHVQGMDDTPIQRASFDSAGPGGLAWSPAADVLAIAGERSVWFWEPRRRREPSPTKINHALQLAWRPDGGLLAVLCMDAILLVDPQTRQITHATRFHRPYCAGWDPSGRWIVAGCKDGSVRILDPYSSKTLHVLRGHGNHVRAVAWKRDGTRIASGGQDKAIRLWDTESWTEVFRMICDEDVRRLAWSPQGSTLASYTEDGCVRLFAAPDDRPR